MSWDVTATNSGGEKGEVPAAGNYPGVLIGLIDLGHHDEEYQGKRYVARKVLLAWELTGEHRADGTPFVVTRDFNFLEELGKKAGLRVLLESWRGKPLEDGETLPLDKLLGRPCLINISVGKSAKGNEFAKIGAVTPPPRGMTVPRPSHAPYEWEFGTGRDFEPPDWLPYLYGKPIDDHLAASYEGRGLPVPDRAAGNGKGPGPAVPLGVGVGVAGGETADDSYPF